MIIPAELTQLDLEMGGRTRHFRLREPTAGEVIGLVLDPDLRASDLVENRLALELYRVFEEPDWSEVKTWVRSPEILGPLLHARNRLYNHLADQGRALAECPFCDGPPVELDLLFYWMTLRLPKWDFFDRGVLMHLPSLSSKLPAGSRPDQPPRARRIGFTYPGEPSLHGQIHPLTNRNAASREEAYWERYVPEDADLPDQRAHWRRNSPGFRAILRLAVALSPDPHGREITPADVDELPLGVFLFLDLLHFATVNVDVPNNPRAQVACRQCGQQFLPVL
jgi:hypothetical protein